MPGPAGAETAGVSGSASRGTPGPAVAGAGAPGPATGADVPPPGAAGVPGPASADAPPPAAAGVPGPAACLPGPTGAEVPGPAAVGSGLPGAAADVGSAAVPRNGSTRNGSTRNGSTRNGAVHLPNARPPSGGADRAHDTVRLRGRPRVPGLTGTTRRAGASSRAGARRRAERPCLLAGPHARIGRIADRPARACGAVCAFVRAGACILVRTVILARTRIPGRIASPGTRSRIASPGTRSRFTRPGAHSRIARPGTRSRISRPGLATVRNDHRPAGARAPPFPESRGCWPARPVTGPPSTGPLVPGVIGFAFLPAA